MCVNGVGLHGCGVGQFGWVLGSHSFGSVGSGYLIRGGRAILSGFKGCERGQAALVGGVGIFDWVMWLDYLVGRWRPAIWVGGSEILVVVQSGYFCRQVGLFGLVGSGLGGGRRGLGH